MAKKNDDLIRVLTLLPWWVNLSLAPLAYLLASRAAPAMLADNAFAPVFGPVFAYLGIALAAFFVVAAVVSFVGSIRKRRLLDRQTSLDSIRALSWRQFEELVAEAFRRDGYRVIENDQPGPDDGVDIRLHRDGARHLVQCKNWRSRRVGVRVVREVYDVLTAENAQHAFIVSSGDFTADARGFAAGQPITLVDGDALHAMVQGARRPDGNDRNSADMVPPDTSPDSAPPCPQCGGRLVVRTARRGEFAGRGSLAARPIRAAATPGILPTPDSLPNLPDARRQSQRHPHAWRSRWRVVGPATGATTRTADSTPTPRADARSMARNGCRPVSLPSALRACKGVPSVGHRPSVTYD